MTPTRKTTLRPLHDRVLLKRVEEETVRRGIIIAVGKGKVADDGTKTPLDVKAGDRVLFARYTGSEVKLDGEEYLVMKEEDLLGVLSS
jgi:chaperonin GroES